MDQPRHRSLKFILIIAIVILVGAGLYLVLRRSGYIETFKIAKQIQTQKQAQENALSEDKLVLEKLKSIILLPENATPTMALVTDANILKEKNPSFFANAKNGDRLVVYPELAILYDYQANKIIKIGPVEITPPEPVAATTTANTLTPKKK